LLIHLPVAVFLNKSLASESNLLCRVSWDEVPIDYVVDSLHIVTHNKHVIHSMAYEGEDKAKAYSLVHDDEGTCSQIPKVSD
jgi:hypothetical protein